jgi:uncharacterized RDD family membrane protein YckC
VTKSAAAPLVAVRRAGFVTRAAAFFVDAVIITTVLRSTAWLLGAMARTLGSVAAPVDVDLATLVLASSPILVAIYLVAFWCAIGQTPGKWLMGIEVVASDGGRLTLSRALLRVVGYVVSALPAYLGFLWVIGPRRRGWHDRIADTDVVYAPRRRLVTPPHAAPTGAP